MNKAVLFAAALLLAPLPAMSQEAAGPRSSGSAASTAENPSYAPGGEQSPSDVGELLDRLARSELGERMSSAIDRVEDACGDDIEQYCGDVTPGGGRIAACMRAHSDMLSCRCRFTLARTARNVRAQCAQRAEHQRMRAAEKLLAFASLPDRGCSLA